MSTDRTRALAALTLTALIWGFTTVVVRTLAVAAGARDVLAIRMAISVVVMAAALTLVGGWRIERRDVPRLVLSGVLGITAYNVLSTYGLERTAASLAGLILGTEPLWIAMFAALLLGERVRPVTAVGLVLAAAGTAFLVLHEDSSASAAALPVPSLIGPLLMLASAMIWSLSTVLAKPLLPKYGATRMTLLTGLAGALPLLGLTSERTAATAASLSPWLWALMLHLAVIGSILSLQLWSYGMKHIASAEAAAFIYAVPLISVVAGVLILGEPITLGLVVGGALILAGVALAQFARS